MHVWGPKTDFYSGVKELNLWATQANPPLHPENGGLSPGSFSSIQ